MKTTGGRDATLPDAGRIKPEPPPVPVSFRISCKCTGSLSRYFNTQVEEVIYGTDTSSFLTSQPLHTPAGDGTLTLHCFFVCISIVYYIQGNIVCLRIVSNLGGEQSNWSRFKQTVGLEDWPEESTAGGKNIILSYLIWSYLIHHSIFFFFSADKCLFERWPLPPGDSNNQVIDRSAFSAFNTYC